MGIETIISQFLSQAARTVRTHNPALDTAIAAFARYQQHATGTWAEMAKSGIVCSVQFGRPGGSLSSCGQPAIGTCMSCGGPACYDHSFVSVTGELVCRGCIHVQLLQGRAPATNWPPPPPAPEAKSDESVSLRKAHMRTLGLKGRINEEMVRSAYKKRAARAHPDRFPEEKKAAASARFIELGKARDWLLADLERRKA